MMDIDPFAPEARRKKILKDWFLPNHFRTEWVESSVHTAHGITGAASALIASGTSHVGSSLEWRRLRYAGLAMMVVLGIITVRLLYVQLWSGSKYRALAVNNSENLISIPAERGLIIDAKGLQLVENVPSFALYLSPTDLPKKEPERSQVLIEAARLSEISIDEVGAMVNEYKAFQQDAITLREDIPYDSALSLEVASANLPGINIGQGSKRLYGVNKQNTQIFTTSTGWSMAHVLGYVGKMNPEELKKLYTSGYLPTDTIGKSGLEKWYESTLRGEPGKRRLQVNAGGIDQSVIAETAPVPGSHLQLNIDLELQQELERVMRNILLQKNKTRAAGVAINPQNGAVLALVSLPGFNNNDFSGGISSTTYRGYLENPDNPLFNRAIGGTYPSGSNLKPAIAAAALEEGVIDENTSFLSNGGLRVGPWFFPDWKAGGHGQTDVAWSIAWSVNTFYYYIGGGFGNFHGLGVERITAYLRRFGFGTELGIDLPGEQSGFVPSRAWKEQVKKEPWYIGDTYNLSIGQGDFLTTPLQIASMTAIISNGGTIYKPQVVDATINPVTNEKTDIEPVVLRSKILSARTIAAVQKGMRDCVEIGSCRQLKKLDIRAGGKTGTAQWNATKENHAWFTSYAPAEKPTIALTILVEEGVEGSTISEPMAYEFYKWWKVNRM